MHRHTNVMSTLREKAKRHPSFGILLLLEFVFILFLAVGLFQVPFSVRLTAQDFAQAVEAAGTDQYLAGIDGETLAFTIQEDVKQQAIEDDKNETALWPLQSSGRALRSGAYEVTIHYQADSTSPSTEAAIVKITEQRFTDLVEGEKIVLDGASNTATGRIWVQLGARAEDVVVQLTPRGECDFQIQEILLQEQPVYRWVRLLAFLLLFAVADILGFCLFVQNNGKVFEVLRKHWEIAALAFLCILACLPLFTDGLLRGDDMDFHLTRIAHLAQGLQDGQFPVRLYANMLNGYGYAAPLYYCDLLLYIPAILYNCMLPLQTCYKVYCVLVTVGTAAACWGSLRHIFGKKEIALTGTVLYVLAGYRLCNVYMRSAVGEYTAMVWLPLIVWGVYEIFRQQKPTWKHWMPLAVGMAGIVQCHVISCEIVCVFLLFFCLLNLKKTLQSFRLAALFKAAGMCVALCAWFLVPMLYSMATQDILGTQALPADFQGNGVSLYELLALFPTQKYNSSLGALGASITLGTVVAIFVLWQRAHWNSEKTAIQKLLQYSLGLGVVAMVFTLNKFPWNSLLSHVEGTFAHKLVALAQFPWRYLTISTILLTVATTAALYVLQKNRPDLYRAGRNVLLATAVLYTSLFSYNLIQVRTEVIKYDPIARDENTIGMAEYKLQGNADLNYARPQTESDTLLIKWYDKTDGVAHITLENTAEEEAVVVLPIYDYGNYHAKDSQGTEWPLTMTDDSLLQLSVPGGYSGSISVWYQEPLAWRVAELVSLIAWAGLTGCLLQRKKRKKSFESAELTCDL